MPGLAAAQSALDAQQVFTAVNTHLEKPLTDDERASLLQARNEEVPVSVFISLVINNVHLLDAKQQDMLNKFHTVAQAERVSKLLVEQSCPELAVELTTSR